MDHPNILLVCADHWPGRLSGAAGHPCALTPTLDQLAANGTRFANCYSATPTCIPARRALMTGTTAQRHGDRIFNETLPMPAGVSTLAQTCRDAGYQAMAVGKLHVYPQRDRIGFDDVWLQEEGRHHVGLKADDWEQYVAEQGYAGQQYAHGMCANDYLARPWHLPERLHYTYWTTHEMCRAIKRRDPSRPAFWYLSYSAPHPPLVPPAEYLDLYRDADIPQPYWGEWALDFDALPYPLKVKQTEYPSYRPAEIRLARQAFYAQCTYIDHQMRLVLGLLREENLLQNTIVAFTADHGDMLGNHGLYDKSVFYEDSANVPLVIVPAGDYRHLGHHQSDDRLVELRDIMPTLLEMAGIAIPPTVEGVSLLAAERRDHLYGEHYENDAATRMIRSERFKLIYYAVGNRRQLFDMATDPDEMRDLSGDPAYGATLEALTETLVGHLYGSDLCWVEAGRLVGMPDKAYAPQVNRGLRGQRGWRFVDPPAGARY